MNLLALAEDETYDSEADEDFVAESSSEEDEDEEMVAAEAVAVDPRAVAEFYANMKTVALASLGAPGGVQVMPASCPKLDLSAYRAAARRDDCELSKQNVPSRPVEFGPRAAIASLPDIQKLHREINDEFNRVHVKKIRFAGKVFEIQIDPKTQKQKLQELKDQSELDAIQRALRESNVQQVSSLYKSHADWTRHVQEQGQTFEMAQHRRGQGALLDKQQFLQKVHQEPPTRKRRRRP